MKKINLSLISIFALLVLSGCGQRIIGNPNKYSYQEYTNFHGYRQEQLKQAEAKDSQVNPQSVIPNQKRIAEPAEDFNKSCKHLK